MIAMKSVVPAHASAENPNRSHAIRNRVATLCLPFLSVLFCIIAGEALIRMYHFFRWDISIVDGQPRKVGGLSSITLDSELGWRATENYRSKGLKYSSDGSSYLASVSQDERGFRMFGKLSSAKPRVFVIGDSFTQATAASDQQTYYAVLQRLLNVEVFAYGGGGYGNLQEFMILDRYLDLIRPSLILWQFCTNDLINNSPQLETASVINNNGMVRPYWVNHQISYILPKQNAVDLQLLALQYCRLCYIVMNRLDRLQAANTKHTIETETGVGKPAHAAFVESVKTTDEIMAMVRKRAGSTPIVGFLVGAWSPFGPEYVKAFDDISRHNHILLLDDIDHAVQVAEEKGAVARAADGGHWNELGHRLAGEAIATDFRKYCLLNLCQSDATSGSR
jgi:hypothetical protein